jgi:serine protease Do
MNAWETAAAAAALAAAAGIGAAVAPAGHAQTAARVAPRALDVLGGRGSQIGVSIRDLRDDDKGAQAGVLVEEVSADSPAEKAGIKKGDIIIEFDGERVRSVRQFTRLVQETPAGRKVSAALVRDGQRITVSIEPRESDRFHILTDMPNLRVFENFGRDFNLAVPPAPPALPAQPSRPTPPAPPVPGFDSFVWRVGNMLGLTASDLSSQLAAYFGAKNGVLVTSVNTDSAAAKAGVKAGDVITSINGGTVESVSDLRRRVQRLENGDEFTLEVVRDKKTITLKGKFEETRYRRTFRS